MDQQPLQSGSQLINVASVKEKTLIEYQQQAWCSELK